MLEVRGGGGSVKFGELVSKCAAGLELFCGLAFNILNEYVVIHKV